MTQKIEISAKTIIFAVIFLLFLKVLWVIRELVYALFLSFIFMSALKPVVNLLERKRVPRFLAVLLLLVVVLSLISLFFTFVIPPLVQESIIFFKTLPEIMTKMIPGLSLYINADSVGSFLPDLTQNVFKVVSGVFSNFVFVITIIFFTFYFLLEEKFLRKFLDKFLEDQQAERIVLLFEKIEARMGAWVRGELVLMIVVGVMSYIGLSLLKVKYVLSLSIIAGILEVAPIIGPVISAIPAFFVAASSSWFMGFSAIALYFLIQQLENNIVVPYVMRKAVGINPIITLIALTIGGKLGGFFGILLAVPFALFIETLLVEFSKMRR